MAYCREISLPSAEPVSLADLKAWVHQEATTADDAVLTSLITAARRHAEKVTGRILAQRQFAQVLDSFPYYIDTMQGGQAYPPNYYSAPRSCTTLWNYSQMIKLRESPVKSVDLFRYVGSDQQSHTLAEFTDFVLDRESEPARLFPMPGKFWPPCLYVPNAVEIHFTAGYDVNPAAPVDTETNPDTPPAAEPDSKILLGLPEDLQVAIKMIAANWYENREASSPLTMKEIPHHAQALLDANTLLDFAPTRG